MKPSRPKTTVWLIGIIAGLLGIIGHYAIAPVITEYNYELLLVGFVALALGTSFKGM